MNLCSIINVWACCLELLPYAIDNHLKFCDGVIIVWSSTSNHGNSDNGRMLEFVLNKKYPSNVLFAQKEPSEHGPLIDETMKRNYGLELAKEKGYTHFIIADADEFYEDDKMNYEKKRFEDPNLNGLVHELQVFIKSPTLYCKDHTLVAGIHKLKKDTGCGAFKHYPFAYDTQGNAHIDPSRRINYTDGIEMSDWPMYHMSYVRKDINLKIENSSANLRRSRQVIYDELRDAKPGYISRLYHQPLQECPNYFNIVI
jgi:hypothetical protein